MIKEYLVIFIIVFLNTTVIQSQWWESWVMKYDNNNSDDYLIDMATEGEFIYITGWSNLDNNPDIITIKYDRFGSVIWTARYDGPGHYIDEPTSIAVDLYGNVYVTGQSYTEDTGLDYITIKYNATGEQLWASRYFYENIYTDKPYKVKVDFTGNVYVTGFTKHYAPNIGNNDLTEATPSAMTTIKYNANGEMLWVNRYLAESGALGRDLVVDIDGNVYVTGSKRNSANFDIPVLKYSQNGELQWIYLYGSTGTDEAFSIAKGNSIYVSGVNSENDIVTIKISSSGNEEWVESFGYTFGGCGPRYLKLDQYDNIYITGYCQLVDNWDMYTLKYQIDGTLTDVRVYNGPDNYSDMPMGLFIEDDGTFTVTGYSGYNSSTKAITIRYLPNNEEIVGIYSENSTNSIPQGVVVIPGGRTFVSGYTSRGNNNDFFTVCYRITEDNSKISKTSKKSLDNIGNYPNPFNPKTEIQFNLYKTEFINIKIFDLSGKEIETLINKSLNEGYYKITWDGSKYSSGVYFYIIETESTRIVKRMVLLK